MVNQRVISISCWWTSMDIWIAAELSRADVVTFSSCAMALERRSKWYLGVRSFVASTSKGGLTNKNWMNIYIFRYILWIIDLYEFMYGYCYLNILKLVMHVWAARTQDQHLLLYQSLFVIFPIAVSWLYIALSAGGFSFHLFHFHRQNWDAEPLWITMKQHQKR